MKKTLLFALFFISAVVFAQQVTISPSTFNVTEPITITVSFASSTCNSMGSSPSKVYMHAGIGNDNDAFGFSVVGNWGKDDGIGLMNNNGNGTWSKTITPSDYFGINATQQSTATKLGMVFRNASGSQELKKAPSCTDFIFNVGSFQVTLTSPLQNSTTILASGSNLAIAATHTNGNATYNLKTNGTSIDTKTTASSYSYTHTNIVGNQNYDLEVTQGTTTISKKFTAVVSPTVVTEAIPAGKVEGINYDPNDATKAILVLDAPLKDFVYVAGSFNNWQPTSTHAMKKDAASESTKFWLELTNLKSGEDYTYQYWVVKQNPLAGSPSLVKTADPYSTLVLNSEDSWIPSTTFPNLPAYPVGQSNEVTWLKTGQTPYNWSAATTNFVKPDKEKLVVYEVLVRDFDADRNYQNIIDRIDYFKNLKVNAIQLMPVMEFEGNESWGYNTSFHMALDKFYGTPEKLKELIDLCHQNGIAVILDIALNHAFGRNPMVRMWMNATDANGFGSPTTENPYFNTEPMHDYNVGSDFNHQLPKTQNYVKRVVEHWIKEYKIDGFRWDLTKGFTQNCPANVAGGQGPCTDRLQQDRVDVLKKYADFSWAVDPSHYVIFEHLGSDAEEKQWANYKDGIMLWGKMTNEYNELSMGWPNKNIARMANSSRGFNKLRLMGYAESHDEERLMYKNLQHGNSNTNYNVKNLHTALSRMSAIGAVSLLVPGPKMIWHFGELGWEPSIFSCKNGVVNLPGGTDGDCKLDTKPQPQWANDWLGYTERSKIYSDWSKMINLKINEPVFLGEVTISSANSVTPNIKITNSNLAATELKDVLIISNFGIVASNVATGFQYTGAWYDLMDDSSLTVTDVNQTITLQPGEFKIYGNKKTTLSVPDFEKEAAMKLYPNPATNYFTLNFEAKKVEIYSLTGQVVKQFTNIKSQDFQFGISEFPKGLYFIKAYTAENKVQVLKLMKN